MKNYYCYFLLVLFCASCDSTDTPLHFVTSASSVSLLHGKSGDTLPYNSDNGSEHAGSIYTALSTSYYAQPHRPIRLDSVIAAVQLTARSSSSYTAHYGSVPVFISVSDVEQIMADPVSALDAHLSVSLLSIGAATGLRSFSTELSQRFSTTDDYGLVYAYITDYEKGVASNALYTRDEKEALLHITSVVRHAIYAKKKRRKKRTDLDWDWMTTHFAGGSAGSDGDYARGLLTALVVDIAGSEVED